MEENYLSHPDPPSALSLESSVATLQADSGDLARVEMNELEYLDDEDISITVPCSESTCTGGGVWEIEFDEGVGSILSHTSPMSDMSTVTSVTLGKTIDTANLSSSRTDPPFAVGDEVLCDPSPKGAIQRALVVEANHPRYLVQLEGGRLLDTAEVGATLTPLGPYTDHSDDPFADARLDLVRKGSFGLHIDTQRESLNKIKEAKEFAKAVKADDAEVPVYLWNERIKSSANKEDRDRALTGFRKFGLSLFIKALRRDAIQYLRDTYGDWMGAKQRGRIMMGLLPHWAKICGEFPTC